MSLSEAVLVIADEMEKDADSCESAKSLYSAMKEFAKQLRLVVKASANVQPVHKVGVDERVFLGGSTGYKEGSVLAMTPEQRHEEFKRKEMARHVNAEEDITGSMVEFVGGAANGDMAPLDSKCPVGAKTKIGNEVYVLSSERKFVYSEEETRKYNQNKS